jgi:flagellar biogenesis protein FliO
MANALIVVALVVVGVYVMRRVLRSPPTRGIDIGALSDGWLAERRRDEP